MAVAKVVALLLLFALVLTTGVFSDEEPTTTPGSASEIQLEQLHAKIHALDMAVAKVVALLLLFALVLTTGVFSDEEPTTTPGSASEIQLEQLHAKIHALGFASFSLGILISISTARF
ncbi:hypothetical protein F2Q70_00041365 [Brassica cretica]|uniref:Transmembrane protein n=1 Tax=Brassica cretica TaxID=69181 RepID=A0A8S9K9Q9_BRACR|nr:hypothetical protein F2Q70_00041365 [Brassica cretica]